MSNYKQLLKFRGKTFVKGLVEKLYPQKFHDIYCITGFLDKEIKEELAGYELKFIHNSDYALGQTNSLKCAMKILQAGQLDAAMIVLTDQPLISAEHYKCLLENYRQNEHELIATQYSDTFGVPAIFSRKYFNEIIELDDDSSPKTILKKHKERVALIECEEAAMDIDTDEDYKNLSSNHE